ncbi:cellulose-binding protein [Aspergillus arachidicola]|uniref:Cellulose-binding protein n=1 Tax=Aspergillus arachidicola TaxID=656916 RepID=A0A2G7FP63_9EURO|nr:cellulose-binding protein [Aspergillus arachidicola]
MALISRLLILYTSCLTLVSAITLNSFPNKPRVFVLSDISNEPDDSESLVRYLTYSNQFQTEGLVATTSTWLKNETDPDAMLDIIDAYEKVVDNLNHHAPADSQYPSAEQMRSLVRAGSPVYGMAALAPNATFSAGAELLLDRIQATTNSSSPLWVLAWGGTNVLAQALVKLHKDNSPNKAAALRKNLRIYTISDQDDTGAWLRQQWPDLFWINSIHGWNQYGMSTWVGISGDEFYDVDKGGPNSTLVSKAWLKENIQVGTLGAVYPDVAYTMEGDTPTFLYLIQNGLGVSEHPEYGSWGGRYQLVTSNQHGLGFRHYSDVQDQVVGLNGNTFKSNKATIWRWRDAYQHDFAARMRWTLTDDVKKVNHHPLVKVNGSSGLEPVNVYGVAGSEVVVDAGESVDPDGDELTFNWIYYPEPSTINGAPDVNVTTFGSRGESARLPVPVIDRTCEAGIEHCDLFHFILEVKDSGSPPLTTYRRILLHVAKSDAT